MFVNILFVIKIQEPLNEKNSMDHRFTHYYQKDDVIEKIAKFTKCTEMFVVLYTVSSSLQEVT